MLVPESSLEDAKDAIEAMTEPDDIGGLTPCDVRPETSPRRYDELRPADDGGGDGSPSCSCERRPRGRKVLDVGCGTGRLAAALAERFACKVWGVDVSAEMLAVARERLPRGVALKSRRGGGAARSRRAGSSARR